MLGDSRRLIRLIVVFSVAALAVLALLIVVGTVGGQDTISENPPSDSGNPVIPRRIPPSADHGRFSCISASARGLSCLRDEAD